MPKELNSLLEIITNSKVKISTKNFKCSDKCSGCKEENNMFNHGNGSYSLSDIAAVSGRNGNGFGGDGDYW